MKTIMNRIFTLAAVSLATVSHGALANQCEYEIVDEWNQGFKAEITISNGGEAITDWQIDWQWSNGETFNNGWNANYDCNGSACTITPPSWFNQINTNSVFTFGFIGNKPSGATAVPELMSDVCAPGTGVSTATWILDDSLSSVHYVSVKKDHTPENNTFSSDDDVALQGSVSASGEVRFAIDLNTVNTGVDIRNTRLLALLFETEFLPTAWFTAQLDMTEVNSLVAGEFSQQIITGDLVIHGARQEISAEVMVAKLSDDTLSVSSVQPVVVDSDMFDMDAGIEALRLVAGLSSIGETVPVYFHLQFNSNEAGQAIAVPSVPNAPTGLAGAFDEVNLQANLSWQDNSNNESLYLVRRREVGGQWQTIAELGEQANALIEALPDAGEFDYKVIAVNQGMPSLPSNEVLVTVTQGNQVVRGMQLFQNNCAGCHGVSGEGIGGNPPLNTERSLPDMIDYIRDFMPLGDPTSCDQACAEDLATYIETLWVRDVVCDVSLTPVSYGARQLKILTRFEYQNTVEDLVGIDYEVSTGLSADSQVGFFLNNTQAAMVPTAYSNYLLVAEEVADWSAQRDFAPLLSCTAYDQNCADSFVDDVAPKFFRRPLTEDESSAYSAIADGSETGGDVKAGITLALEGLLSSPQFLYRHELGESNPANTQIDSDAFELTSYEMATFLAYTFTGSTPDDILLAAAANDELRTTANIVAQAERLAGNANGIMGQFIGGWLGTNSLDQAAKDPDVWPGFDELVPHMQNEINTTFAHIMLDPDQSFGALYNSNFTFLNEALATHYGIDGVTGEAMQKVDTVDRGGILASGAFMARWGEAVETSPILRSVRVRRRMMCQDQPDPPAGTFAAREEKLAELAELLQQPTTTNRLKYHRLTEDAPCTNCHTQYINPLGFGMEDFDTVGRVRTQDLNGNTINAAGELYAPESYSNVDEVRYFDGSMELGSVLAGLDSAQSCLPKQLFRYVMGVGHQDIDPANPEGVEMSDEEKSGYTCEVDALTDTMLNESPRAMFEKFGSLEAVRYRKAWVREN